MLRPISIEPIPHDTPRVACAACPQGNRYLRLADAGKTWFIDDAFRALFPTHGQPAWPPWRLALTTILPCAEGLPDRQAAHAVRSRIDWKDGLRLERTDPGCEASVLREFRTRLMAGTAAYLRFDTRLTWCRNRQLITAEGRQRTDSTPILAAIQALNRIEVVAETWRHAINSPAQVAAASLRTVSCTAPLSLMPVSSTPNSSLSVATTMASICWGPHASTLTGKSASELALTPSTARLIGTSSTRPVRPVRSARAGRRPWA